MYISFSTIITINVSLGVLLLFLLPVLNSTRCLSRINSGCIVAFFIVVLIRALIPVEFFFAKTIPSENVMVFIRDVLRYGFSVAGHVLTVGQILLAIWIIGVILLLGRKIFLCLRLARLIKKMPDAKNKALLKAWEHVNEKYPKTHHIRLAETTLKVPPFAAGFLAPVIVLPKCGFSETEYEFILEHELQHCIHRDILVKLLTDLLCTLCWWNPLSWLLKKMIFDCIEIGNDKRVIKYMTEEKKNEYMECLVHTARVTNVRQPEFVVHFSRFDYKVLKKRLKLISGYRAFKKRWSGIPVFLLLMVLLCLCTSYTYEPYSVPDGYISPAADNSYIVHKDGLYEIYYNGILLETTNSLEYVNENIVIYEENVFED